jgi:hypothetical protein
MRGSMSREDESPEDRQRLRDALKKAGASRDRIDAAVESVVRATLAYREDFRLNANDPAVSKTQLLEQLAELQG